MPQAYPLIRRILGLLAVAGILMCPACSIGPQTKAREAKEWQEVWSRFLTQWQTADARNCAYAFAKDSGHQGSVSFSDALNKLRDIDKRKLRLSQQQLSQTSFPLKITLTTYWTISEEAGSASFRATQEVFDIALIDGTPLIVAYEFQDTTSSVLQRSRQFIARMSAQAHDQTLSADEKLTSMTSAAIQSADVADIDGFWGAVTEAKSMGLYQNSAQLARIKAGLKNVMKDDPIPQACKGLAEELESTN